MTERATGLILRTRPLTDTSLIVQWLTFEWGRMGTVARGARRPKSPFRGKLDLFYLADFSFRRSRRSSLHTLCEVGVRRTHPELRREMAALEQAAYAVRLIEQTTESETPLPDIFRLLLGLLDHLACRPANSLSLFAFELKLLGELGLRTPDPELEPESRSLVERLAVSDWPVIGEMSADDEQRRGIGRFLHGFLIYHLGRIPSGRPC